MQPERGEHELVERARRGDVDAYGELVRRHQDQALAAAYVILGDRQEAEDASQEAFTNAFLALERFRPDASFRAWLLRIVVNEARDLLSARRRRADLLSRAAGGIETIGTTESAEAAAFSERRHEAILVALFDLPEADRLVVTCRYFLDLSEAEIADVLGIARGTVKSRLSRALARLGPILRDLGPLVVVPPVIDLEHAVATRVGGKTLLGSALSKLRSKAQQSASLAAAGAAVVVIASAAMVSSGRSAPAGTTPQPVAPGNVIVYGGDLTDADRQELATDFATGATATDAVSRQELVDTLGAQGIPVQPSDAAISSVQLACGAVGSGLQVQTYNINGITAAEYAVSLITAGVYDASVVVAAPTDKSVSGETALVGIFKAYPACSGGTQAAAQRIRLAYQQLKLTGDMASNSDLTHASAVTVDMLNAIMGGGAPDASAVQRALDSAAAREGITMDDSTRGEAVSFFEQLRQLDYGPYTHGLAVEQRGHDYVRVMAAE